MSCREIGAYLEARQEREQAEKKAEFMDSAALLNGLFTQLRAYFITKDSRVLTPRDLYPSLFEEKPSAPVDISPERKQEIITNTWKAFLGV